MEIRALTEHDVEAWRKFRIRMLREHPEAFSESLQDFEQRHHAEVRRRVFESHVIGVFEASELIGCAGWISDSGHKRRHLGTRTSAWIS